MKRKWDFLVWVFPAGAVFIALLIVGAVLWSTRERVQPGVRFTTPYQAVILSNGQMFFGRLEGYGATGHPILREVYYIQSGTNPKTNEAQSILVKRGKEWHGPDHMVLNENQIVLVEPVRPDSKVAELITALKMQ